jgi:hypothetical protein
MRLARPSASAVISTGAHWVNFANNLLEYVRLSVEKAGVYVDVSVFFVSGPLTSKPEDNVTNGRGHSRRVAVSVACLLLAGTAILTAAAQEKRGSQTAGVDNTKMGPYRALAQLAFAASQKGDNATAAQLAKILERTWDKAEDYGGDTALSKTNHGVFEQIDKAMDQFITTLMEHATSAPDAAKVKSTYNLYMEKLKLAD